MVAVDEGLSALRADSAGSVLERVGVTDSDVMIERTLVDKVSKI